MLDKIQEKLFDEQKLNKPFVINEEDYLIKPKTSAVAPLPEQPMPNLSIVQSPPPTTQTGLTPTEQALLSEEERMIALRNRGLV